MARASAPLWKCVSCRLSICPKCQNGTIANTQRQYSNCHPEERERRPNCHTERRERRRICPESLLSTTNLPFSEWTQVIPNARLNFEIRAIAAYKCTLERRGDSALCGENSRKLRSGHSWPVGVRTTTFPKNENVPILAISVAQSNPDASLCSRRMTRWVAPRCG